MRPDELSALAAIDLLEMMFKSGVIAGPVMLICEID